MAARPQLRLEHLDPETYKSFEPDAREDLLIREISFNALTIFDYQKVPALTRSTAEAHVTFGHFYGAWYIDDSAKNRFAFERAILYLNKALESGEESVMTRVKTALGVLYTWRSAGEAATIAKDLRDKALTNFDAVLKENPIDARCLLGAAWSIIERTPPIARFSASLNSSTRSQRHRKRGENALWNWRA